MSITDAKFRQVPLNSREPNACSPDDPGPEWRGVVIRAPGHVRLDAVQGRVALPSIPVCGLYNIEITALMSGAPMMAIVTDVATRAVHKGAIVEEDPGPDIPNPRARPLDPKDYAGVATSSYFNPDLPQYVSLPARPAAYDVRIEYGGQVSNTVRITIDPP